MKYFWKMALFKLVKHANYGCIFWPRELDNKLFLFQHNTKLDEIKGPPFSFFGISKFFQLKGPSIFLMFCDRNVESQRVPLLTRQFGPTFGFFGYQVREYFDTLKVLSLFLSLKYSTDLGRSRLVRLCDWISNTLHVKIICKLVSYWWYNLHNQTNVN